MTYLDCNVLCTKRIDYTVCEHTFKQFQKIRPFSNTTGSMPVSVERKELVLNHSIQAFKPSSSQQYYCLRKNITMEYSSAGIAGYRRYAFYRNRRGLIRHLSFVINEK